MIARSGLRSRGGPAWLRLGPVVPISACIITYDEEHKLPDCLASLDFCAEILVVDSHSSDRTRDIARERGARVIERDWPGHIEQKNFAIDQAVHDWVLCVDADERVTPELRAAIEDRFARGDPDVAGFRVNRRNIYLGRWIRGGGWYPDTKLRLFRRSRGRWTGENPHDHVALDPAAGDPESLGADLEHHTYDDIADHLETIQYFSTIAAGEKLARGQGGLGLHLVLNPPLRWFRDFVLQGGFRDGWRGFIVATLTAFYVFVRYAKLWELIHVKGRARGTGKPDAYGRRGELRAPRGVS
jgi:glycosyltransferase involved in cell wall biosynthesis